MTSRSFILASVTALLAFAVGCDAPCEAVAPNGTLEVSFASSARSGVSDGSITITGLDRQLHTTVSLSSVTPRGSLELPLPPGLYGVQWKPNPLDARDTEVPPESAPSMVVVAAGGTSSVVLRAVPAPESSAVRQLASAESIHARVASL